MQIDRILYPVKTLGPGNRLVIWTLGCPHECPGCANPELWEPDRKKDIPLERVFDMVDAIAAKTGIDGITITGGEPFAQLEELEALVGFCSRKTGDILIYTGYTLEELVRDKEPNTLSGILDKTAVLIDGCYVEPLNDGAALRGSSNQQVHILNEKYRTAYEAALKQKRAVENFIYGASFLSVGIHERGYQSDLEGKLGLRGVTFCGRREDSDV